jgi:hypothetical protein
MEELSIFVRHELDWAVLKDAVKIAVNLEGDDRSGEDFSRHQWGTNGYEVVAIESPMYEDDCGIPFSQYSHQLLIHDTAMNTRENHEEQYYLFVRSLAKQMERLVPNKIVIVKNLQAILV